MPPHSASRPVGHLALTVAALIFALPAALAADRPASRAPVSGDELVPLPAGRFQMGSTPAETDREQRQTMHTGQPAEDGFAAYEQPRHPVRLRAFAMARYPVTRGDYARFVAATGHVGGGCYGYDFSVNPVRGGVRAGADWRDPGFAQTDRDPVVCVNQADAAAYIAWLSARTGIAYRLPSEAEYEYAARASTRTSRWWGDDPARQCRFANGPDRTLLARFADRVPAWYGAPCSDGYVMTAPVDAFPANRWGLHDMAGNVFQMVADCWHADYRGAPADGGAWTDGDCAVGVVRGGSSNPHPGAMRSASRVRMGAGARTVFTGFRLARSLP